VLPAAAPASVPGAAPERRRASRLPWLLLLFVVAAVYGPVLAELAGDWIRDPNYSHGMLVPVVAAYLVWRQRRFLAALPPRPAAIGLAGVVVAAALLVVGAAGAEVFTQRLSLVGFLASAVVFLFGWRCLGVTAFPIALLLFAIPLPYVLYYSLTGPLQAIAAKCAVFGLKAAGVPVVAQGNVMYLPDGLELNVAEACSGIRSLYSFLTLGALLGYFISVPFYGRALVFLSTIPLSIACNAFRVWATSILAYFFGTGVTKGTVHDLFGLFVFATGLILLFLVWKGAKKLWPAAS
jgi:exosortase